jgi:hypothetical protein
MNKRKERLNSLNDKKKKNSKSKDKSKSKNVFNTKEGEEIGNYYDN